MSEAYDVIIVLGAQVRPEGIPSEALRRRLALALARYGARPVPVLCCGARGADEPAAEGDFMCDWLAGHGVPRNLLISENQSYDTMQNIRNARRIMRARGLSHALIVTSDYHLPRALAICRRYGLPASGAGSASLPAYRLKNTLRELLAWGKFFLLGWRKE